MEKYAPLWEPLQVGSVTLKNRVVVTAHALQYAENNLMSQQSVDYYEERAKGGAGLIVTEAQAVHPTSHGLALRTTRGWLTESIPVYERLAEAVHRHGAKVFVDLSHYGAEDQNTMFLENWRALWSPSGLPSSTFGEISKPMTHDDINELSAGFARVAKHAQVAGIDGAEVHAAHGYLLSSFLSPLTNRRTDEYGGSTENRCRVVLECGRAVREQCGPDFGIGVRISMTEYVPGGVDEDEGERIVKILADSGLFDYLSISAGNAATFDQVVSPMSMPGARLVDLAIRAKKVSNGLPVLTANGITDLSIAADIISEGHADLVAMTRAHIADPHLISKAQSGKEKEIRHCVSANQGCIARMSKSWSLTCTQNPAAGREKLLGIGTLTTPDVSKRVVVVGGGPAGMRAAEVAASRGHDVVLGEKDDQLGGQIRYAARLATRGRWAVMIRDMERTLAIHKVDIRTGFDATVENIRALQPDHVVMATGSRWRTDGFTAKVAHRPGIPGLQKVTVLDPIEAIVSPELTGNRVLIIDDTGEYLALGLAETLAELGKSVEVISPAMTLGANITLSLDLAHLFPRLYALGVEITPQHFVAEVNAEGAVLSRVWDGHQRVLPVDSIVTVMMRDAQTSLARELGSEFELTEIGDCVAPRRVDEAIYEGEIAGRAV